MHVQEMGRADMDLIHLTQRQGPLVGCSEHDTGPLGSTGGWEFFQLSVCWLFEE
jgi:hypothetical protein